MDANEVMVPIERVQSGSDEWCVACPFCEWARKNTDEAALMQELISHMNALHKGGRLGC